MKTTTMMAAVLCACAALAQETAPELVEKTDSPANWRLTIGGFGRGNVRTKLKGATADHDQLWGADMDVQYNVWENDNINVWVGVGGTFCPNQDAYGSRGSGNSNTHTVSDDGFVTYDFNYNSRDRRSVELGYGELRMMAVPEWKVTERFSIGARVGVALDWMRAKCRRSSSWAWDSRFDINIPGLGATTDTDGDSGSSSDSDSVTEFAAQAIVGIQATYMFTDWIGLYANCDWRMGGDTTFKTDYGDRFSVDMSGWYAGAGVVVQF